ncbi:vacuolar transporter chaperone [Clavispora lusitaniae]|nr:vacuolar transporter chaperone [Clavispora lusitaniae]
MSTLEIAVTEPRFSLPTRERSFTYHWRAKAIRLRGSGPYDDRFGPTMLCVFLLVAVVVNFVLRIRA